MGATLLAGCAAPGQGAARLADKQVFTFGLTSSPPYVMPSWAGGQDDGLSLDPAFSQDVYSAQVLNLIQSQLVTFDDHMNLIPDAATSWKQSADGKTWTFTLQTGLEWSDGQPLTSQDFALGIKHDLDPNLCTDTKSPLNNPDPTQDSPCPGGQANTTFLAYIQGAAAYDSGHAQTISGIQTPDPQTISFTLTQPIAFFPSQMATAASMPLETKVFQQYSSAYILHYPDGVAQSGPFMIQSWGDPSNASVKDPQHSTEIKFVPNPHWWGKKPTLTEIDMPLIPDPTDSYRQYAEGSIDWTQVPSNQFQSAQDLTDFHSFKELAMEYFAMNHKAAPFDNLQVRQAFDLALNKQLLVDTVFQGARTPTNHIIPFGIPGYDTALLNPPDTSASAALTGNQSKAQDLIKTVAGGCQKSDQDWCPFVIGSSENGAAQLVSIQQVNPNCPINYNVFATKSGSTYVSTQQPIFAYATLNHPDRVTMTQDAAQEWSNVLCLNVSEKSLASGSALIHDLGKAENGTTVPETLWTLGYAADYADPQDFTSLQFAAGSSGNFSNFGVDQQEVQVQKQMQQADVEPDRNKRYQMYQQIEQLLVDEVAWIPYDQNLFIYRVRQYDENFNMPADQIVPDQDWPNIAVLAH